MRPNFVTLDKEATVYTTRVAINIVALQNFQVLHMLSLDEIAKFAGVSIEELRDIYCGRVRNIKREKAVRIAKVLNTHLHSLVE